MAHRSRPRQDVSLRVDDPSNAAACTRRVHAIGRQAECTRAHRRHHTHRQPLVCRASRRRAGRQDDLHVTRGVGSVALHSPQLGADVEAEGPRARVVFREIGITPVEPTGFPVARFIWQVELAAQRRQPAAGRPEEPLVEAPAVDSDGTSPDDVRDAQLGKAMAPDVAERLARPPSVQRRTARAARADPPFRTPAAVPARTRGEPLLAQRGPCRSQGCRLVRQLTDGDAHGGCGRRYQTRTRAEGSRYRRWPGRTSNASYPASRFRTVSAR